jgi:RHS repeat-associated protein
LSNGLINSYDLNNNLIGVPQNAQAAAGSQQTRSYAFDFLSRLTSETNPESGTTTYTYDTDPSCGSSSGDLVKLINAAGNMICYYRDALHRATGEIIYYAPNQQGNRYFVYDTATVNGQAMQNGKARLVEAFTAGCPTCSKITDVGFSYTGRGEVSDAYQSTPHSGSYYHVSQTYWPHGAPSQLSATAAGVSITGLPNISYGGTIGSTVGLDGKGRITQVTAASGLNPITTAVYNSASLPTQVTFGSGDSDIFAYDSNTLRMNSYQFKVGTQSVTGTIGWNANGSLGTLGIADPFNSANTQNCSFSADDLARITKADCGAVWGQNFSHDPFGNVTKAKIAGSGATSFAPVYQSSPSITNRVSTVNGVSATYDANGNSLNDTFRTFAWDANGNPVTIGSVALTYDAFDRMVEQTVGSTNSEIVYGPSGGKLALMNGTALIKAFVPLTGGATAVYTSSGLAYYRHSDHLGSSRLSSTPTQTVYSETAYSAFGETYASTGAIDPSFTGQNQDTTSGLYDFLARELDPNQGRWASPDPAGLAAVDPSNPQSWNRYAYVQNNPLVLLDPQGLDCIYFNDNYESQYSIFPGECGENDQGYYVDGTVTDTFINSDGQLIGVTVDNSAVDAVGSTWNSFESINVFANAPPVASGGSSATGQPALYFNATAIGPTTNWFYTKQAGCTLPGIKGFIGGLILKKDIDFALSPILGPPPDGNIGVGTATVAAEKGLERVAENRPFLRAVRAALKEEGHRVSANSLARGAKFLSRAALVTHVAFAANDGREDYKTCMEN